MRVTEDDVDTTTHSKPAFAAGRPVYDGRVALQQRLRLLSASLIASATASAALLGSPALAAATPASADVTITRMTPSVLTPGSDLTIRGTVRNTGHHAWPSADVTVVVPRSPLLTHRQARVAIASGAIGNGHRVVGPGATDTVGTLRPGAERRFTLTLSADQLGLSGAEGVYPISVQVRLRGPHPTTEAPVGSANTFLPLRLTAGTPVPTTVLWPFLQPRGAVAPSIERGGTLRQLLNLARSGPDQGSNIVVDPALLSAVGRLAANQHVSETRRAAAQDFRHDLIELAHDRRCWATRFDRPDATALADASTDVRDAVQHATRGTLRTAGLTCHQLDWPGPNTVSRTALSTLPAGVDAVVVGAAAVPAWQSTAGNILRFGATGHSRALVIDDPADEGWARHHTSLTLRQRILSEVTWSAIARGTGGRADTVIVVDPTSAAVGSGQAHLTVAMENKYVAPTGLGDQLAAGGSLYAGAIAADGPPPANHRERLAVAAEAGHIQRQLRRVIVEPGANLAHDQDLASTVSERWIARPKAGLAYSRRVHSALRSELSQITVDGPAALTLSSSQGRFPVTISNHTGHTIAVGTTVTSSNAGVQVSVPRESTVSAGESRTVTASIDMNDQSSTTVSVHLRTRDGVLLGAPSVFNVRSSRMGAALWVAIGISIAFVAFALVRRFARPGHRPEHHTLSPDDFDD